MRSGEEDAMSGNGIKPSCSHISRCELFPKFALRGSMKVWETFYCKGNFAGCARYRLSLEGRPVPANLLPNGRELDLAVLLRATAS
jgi:hypothetical protein